ncbi:hypothetical protein CC1G_01667 [Coprinopsis cinerea okayama7|uniref:Uncharacterized protein n=1 Tax=Coprinopsis cinerea (strain Okayama-7 / 130 / ATCC MYA-4618 / FGSC 9003) TaxID=240176 RepID=A8N2G7_COPC7|nr:hypothetical protein CC1G_01667 [Coprinopsis cinerea okayama7\|eukprot:XP_001828987.2 hypothetical protein CC1G_01667 [Coprinopsis cinerea okayama7\
MAKGIFPRMDTAEIINALSGWGFPVTQQQLIHPTPEFVEGVYFACLQQVTDLNQETLREPIQNSLDGSQVIERDLYTNAFTNNLMLYHITRLARAARIDDFNAKDLSSPERDRTLVILSAFINFVKFTEQYCEAFVKDLRDRSATLLLERDQLIGQVEDIQRAIDVLQAKISEDEPRRVQLQEENKALRDKLFKTKDAQVASVQEVEMLKAEKNNLLKRKEAINLEINRVQDEITRTNSRIVQSPERIKRTIATMSQTTIEDKRTVAMNEAKARDLQAKITALLNIEKDVRGCVEQLQTVEREVHSLQQAQKELADVKDHLDGKKMERNELRMKQERVEKQLVNAQDKLERAQRHAEEKRIQSQKAIERVKKEYEEMSLERRENDKQVEELRKQAHAVEMKMAEHLRASEQELNELLSEYWKLRHETDVFMETLANKLNMRVIAE